ncbi:MAG: hypothetical protein ACI8RZ_006921 [Myxococcota bacterium]|jgi:hypothetical protein
MPLPFRPTDVAEIPIGTHGIFIKSGAGFTEIGFIHVNSQDGELRWHDFTEDGPIAPRDTFYAIFGNSNGESEDTHNIWEKYTHSDLTKMATAGSPSTTDGVVWKITYGVKASPVLSDEPITHPYIVGTNIVGYLSLKTDGFMKWWVKEPAVDNPPGTETGLVRFNKDLNAGQRCLHFHKLNATEIGNIANKRFFVTGHAPLSD